MSINMEKHNLNINLKILMIGESNVGKSSLSMRFTNDIFETGYTVTVGVGIANKKVTVDGYTVNLLIWDTAGQEKFKALTPNYYRGAHGAILVYDVTASSSFKKLNTWLEQLEIFSATPNLVKMVVGNKIDLPNKEVTTEEGMRFSKKHAALFMECSAKNNDGVNCAFEELIQKIIHTPGLWISNSDLNAKSDVNNTITLKNTTGQNSTCFQSIISKCSML